MSCYRFYLYLLVFVLSSTAFGAKPETLGYFRSKGLYVQGVAHCKDTLKRTRKTTKRKIVLLELAACYQFNTRDHTYPEAVKVYRQFLNEFSQDALAGKAYFNIGRCYDAFTMNWEQDIEKARIAYKNCYEKYPESFWADQAYFWYANSFIHKLTPELAAKAAKIFEEFLKRYPESFLCGVVHSQLSELYCAWLKNYKESIRHSEAALACGIRDIKLKRLHFYRLGYLYQFKLKDNKNAVKWYRCLMENSPTKADPNYFVAEKRIKELTEEQGKIK